MTRRFLSVLLVVLGLWMALVVGCKSEAEEDHERTVSWVRENARTCPKCTEQVLRYMLEGGVTEAEAGISVNLVKKSLSADVKKRLVALRGVQCSGIRNCEFFIRELGEFADLARKYLDNLPEISELVFLAHDHVAGEMVKIYYQKLLRASENPDTWDQAPDKSAENCLAQLALVRPLSREVEQVPTELEIRNAERLAYERLYLFVLYNLRASAYMYPISSDKVAQLRVFMEKAQIPAGKRPTEEELEKLSRRVPVYVPVQE